MFLNCVDSSDRGANKRASVFFKVLFIFSPSLLDSESAVDEVTLTNEIKTGHFHSNVSKRLEEAGSQLCQPSLKGAKSLSSGIKRIGSMHLHPAIEQG